MGRVTAARDNSVEAVFLAAALGQVMFQKETEQRWASTALLACNMMGVKTSRQQVVLKKH
jgi:hypothetical protein